MGEFVVSAAEAAATLAGERAADDAAGSAADRAADDAAADDTPVVVTGNGAIEGGTDSVRAGEAGRASEGRGNGAAQGSV